MARLQEAAGSVEPPRIGHSAIADWLNVSAQRVTNWARRGVSREGALAAQEKSGYSANWILTGVGAQRLPHGTRRAQAPEESAEPSVGRRKGDFVKAVTPEEQEMLDALLQDLRQLFPSDRREKLREIAELAKIRKADREELLENSGLPRIMERAAKAVRGTEAATSAAVRGRLRATDPREPELPHIPPPPAEDAE